MLERHQGFRCRRQMVSLTCAFLFVYSTHANERAVCIHSSIRSSYNFSIAKSYLLRILRDNGM